MQTISRAIDALNEKTGLYSSYLILPLIGVVIYEVFMRYVFNAPTSWGFEMTTFLYGMHYMLGLGDAHRTNTHVCIDIFEARMQPRNRTILRIITNLVIFIPTMGCMAIWSIKYADHLLGDVRACLLVLVPGHLSVQNGHGGRFRPLFSGRHFEVAQGLPHPAIAN